jgi:uncharacterized protein
MIQALLDQWYAAVRSNDGAALASVTTDDVVLHWNADPDVLPWGGRHEGRDAVLAFFKTLGEHIEVVRVTVVDRIDAPEATIIVLDGQWRTRAGGREISARACNIFRMRDGKIAAYEVYNDSGKFADALKLRNA